MNGDDITAFIAAKQGTYYVPAGDIGEYRFLYRGYWYDRRLHIYHVRHRAYDPEIQRWLQPDPAYFVDGLNRYAYCGNEPVHMYDPMGLDALDDAVDFIAGWTDTLTLGGMHHAREALGINDTVNPTSTAYGAGQVVGAVHVGAMTGGAGAGVAAAAGGSRVAVAIAAGATSGMFGEGAVQSANLANGNQSSVNFTNLATASVAGGLLGGVAGKSDELVTAWVNRSGSIGETATELARRLGQAGEDAAGIVGPKVGVKVPSTGQMLFPDEISDVLLKEVKNVKYQSLTKQLKGYLEIAEQRGLDFELWMRPDADVSKPLQRLIDAGRIRRCDLPPGTPSS